MKQYLILLPLLAMVACSTAPRLTRPTSPKRTQSSGASTFIDLPKAGSGRGGYYKDDGPGDVIPDGLALTPDAEPKVEPYITGTLKPYTVFGKTYTPITDNQPFTQRGIGSWYGKRYHGLRTSSGEPYDMYKMTAAHPTLPIPSYAKITNLNNGRHIIVKINDRGPFHSDRIVDLSYTAALKLDYLHKGSNELLLERLLPADIELMARNKQAPVDTPSTAPLLAATSHEALTVTPSDRNKVINSVSSGFYLQFGAYGVRKNAEALSMQLQNQFTYLPNIKIVAQGAYFRVLSGPFSTRQTAGEAAERLFDAGVTKPIILAAE